MSKTNSPWGTKKEFTNRLCKFKNIHSSEIYHRSGNLWFKRGLLHENLRQSYVYYVSVC